MDKPLVSLIITTRNNSSTIGRCLQSAIDQDYENLSILVLDNRSEDDTYDVLWDFERKNRDRLYTGRTFAHLSQNELRARSFAMINPRARYVRFLPATDALYPSYISRCIELCGSNERIGCVLTHADIVYPSGQIGSAPKHRPGDCVVSGDEQMEFFMTRGFDLNIAALFRKEIFYLAFTEVLAFNRLSDWLPMIMACTISDIGYISQCLALRGDSKAVGTEPFVPELEEYFEHYLLLQTFDKIAARLGRQRVCEKLPDALRRLSLECIRCSAQLAQRGAPRKGMAYLSLALAYLPEIAQTDEYRQAAAGLNLVGKPGYE